MKNEENWIGSLGFVWGTLMEIHFSTIGVSTVSFPQQFRAGAVMFRSGLD